MSDILVFCVLFDYLTQTGLARPRTAGPARFYRRPVDPGLPPTLPDCVVPARSEVGTKKIKSVINNAILNFLYLLVDKVAAYFCPRFISFYNFPPLDRAGSDFVPARPSIYC